MHIESHAAAAANLFRKLSVRN